MVRGGKQEDNRGKGEDTKITENEREESSGKGDEMKEKQDKRNVI